MLLSSLNDAYKQGASNRSVWGGLERSVFTVTVIKGVVLPRWVTDGLSSSVLILCDLCVALI